MKKEGVLVLENTLFLYRTYFALPAVTELVEVPQVSLEGLRGQQLLQLLNFSLHLFFI